jgi:hypothetical protein
MAGGFDLFVDERRGVLRERGVALLEERAHLRER